MRGKVVLVSKLLVLIAAAVIATGCTSELRRTQGANQTLVRERDALSKQISDLRAELANAGRDRAEMEARLKRALADVEYYKGQAGVYGAAYEKSKTLQEGLAERVMRDLAGRLGAMYLPGGGIRLEGDVLFESGKTTLKPAAISALQAAAQVFASQDARELHLRIDGHTDKVPIRVSGWKDNMELSQARARAVWLELKNRGVSGDRMFTAGFGESRPVVDETTTQAYAMNRRVEIWIVPAPGTAGASVSAPTERLAPASDLITAAPMEELE